MIILAFIVNYEGREKSSMLSEKEKEDINTFHAFFKDNMEKTTYWKNNKDVTDKDFFQLCFDDFSKMEIATNYPSYRNALIHTSICGNANILNDDSAPKGYVMTKNMNRNIDNTTLTDFKQNTMQKVLQRKVGDKPFYKHIEEKDEIAKAILTYYDVSLDKIHNTWEEVKNREILPKDTDNLIAQVFFNTGEETEKNHLLSIYSNSALARQVNSMLYFRKKNGFYSSNIMERYYGDKSRNITTFMKSNYYSFSSCPPKLNMKNKVPVSNSIFKNIVVYQMKNYMESLAKTLKGTEFVKDTETDSFSQEKAMNKWRKDKVRAIISSIADSCFEYRNNLLAKEEGWTEEKPFDKLPLHQRVWIDNNYLSYRAKRKNTDWAKKLSKDFSSFIVSRYNRNEKYKELHELTLDDIDFIEKIFFDLLYR